MCQLSWAQDLAYIDEVSDVPLSKRFKFDSFEEPKDILIIDKPWGKNTLLAKFEENDDSLRKN